MKKAEGTTEDEDKKIEEDVVKIEKEGRQMIQQGMTWGPLYVMVLYTIAELYYCQFLYYMYNNTFTEKVLM